MKKFKLDEKRIKAILGYDVKKGTILREAPDEEPVDDTAVGNPAADPSMGEAPEKPVDTSDESINVETEEGIEDEMDVEPVMDTEETPIEDDGSVEIDVTDITDDTESLIQSSDQTQNMLQNLNNMLQQVTSKFDQISADNQAQIQSIKQELERRVPTNKEKLDLRVIDSGAYTEKPQDYFSSDKVKDRYDINYQDENPQEEYTLTQSDINNINPMSISKSFNVNNFKTGLEDILDY